MRNHGVIKILLAVFWGGISFSYFPVFADEEPPPAVLETKPFKTDQLQGADWKPIADAPEIVEEKLFTKVMKAEVAGFYGWVPTDSFEDSRLYGANLLFHLTDNWGVGLGYFQYINKKSDLTSQFYRNFGVNPEYNSKKEAYYAQIYWTPIYAKLAILGRKISHYELYLGAGLGRFNSTGGSQNTLVGSLGNRFFIFPWLNLRLEYTLFRYKDVVRYTTGLDRGKEVRHWRNVGNAWVGLSFLFP